MGTNGRCVGIRYGLAALILGTLFHTAPASACAVLNELIAQCASEAINATGNGQTCSSEISSGYTTDGQAVYACGITCILADGSTHSVGSGSVICSDPPPGPVAAAPKDIYNDNPVNKCGSIIQVDNLSVGESVPMVGLSDPLYYFTNRVRGRTADYSVDYAYNYQGGVYFPATITIAGRTIADTSIPHAGASSTFTWDGKDQDGHYLLGSREATISFGGVTPSIKVTLGGWRAFDAGLGGWLISSYHFYDGLRKRIYMGDGEIRQAEAMAVHQLADGRVRVDVTPSALMAVSADGSEAYIFDMQGVHQETRSTMSGALLKRFNHDVQKRLTSVVDGFGNVTQIQRPSANLIKIIAPFGQVTQLHLDPNGWAERIEDPGQRFYDMTYVDEFGLLKTFTKPSGEVSTLSYDTNGLLSHDESTSGAFWNMILNFAGNTRTVAMTSAEGRTYTFQIDSSQPGYVRTETSPGGATSTTTYRPGVLSDLVTADGLTEHTTLVTNQQFDAMTSFLVDKVILSTPSGDSSTVLNSQSVTVDPLKNILHPDAQGLTTAIDGRVFSSVLRNSTYTFTSPERRTTTVQINAHDQVVSSRDGSLTPVNFSYDPRGRLSGVAQGARSVTATYNSAGLIQALRNPLNQITHFAYDEHAQLTSEVLPDGREIKFTYDPAGNLASVQPPSRPRHDFVYNLFDLVASYLPPQLSSPTAATTYSYNRDKQLTEIHRPDGSLIGFNYAPASGLLSSVTTPEGSYSGTYNSANQLVSLDSPGGAKLSWSYDSTQIQSFQTTTNSFSGAVNYLYSHLVPTAEIVTDQHETPNAIALAYDGDLLLVKAGDLSLTRNSLGQVTKTKLGNIEENFTYSSGIGEVASYTVLIKGAQFYKESYIRDLLGRITTKTIEETKGKPDTYVYTYDSSGRLTHAAKNGKVLRTYVYDENSNRISVTDAQGKISATYDNQDRLLTYGNSVYTYNNLGERTITTTARGRTSMTLAYDSLGALTQAKLGGLNLHYLNDALGRRLEKFKGQTLKSRYLYDPQGRIVAEIGSDGLVKSRFVFASTNHSPDYMIRNQVLYKYIHDQLGSVRFVLNATTGRIVSKFSYDEFGIVESSTRASFQPFGFAGGISDADTGLVRFGARDYDPAVGRWISKDPILFKGGDTSLYGYSLADPINRIDPTGLASCTYSISSHTLVCTPNEGGSPITLGPAGVFSGNNNFGSNCLNNPACANNSNNGPIPPGSYTIDQGNRPGFFGINPTGPLGSLNNTSFGQNYLGLRGGFELHTGTRSNGCITSNPSNQGSYNQIQNLLTNEMGSNTLTVSP